MPGLDWVRENEEEGTNGRDASKLRGTPLILGTWN